MTLPLTEVLRRVRKVADEVAAPLVERTDREARWPAEAFRALQAAGLGGLVVPSSAGGLGMGLGALARVCEEMASVCPSTAIGFGMHHVAAAVISAKATRRQTKDYLEPIARGEHLTTLALSEPGTGAHFYVPEARLLHRPGGDFEVTGQKSFVTNGGHADSYVVSVCAIDPEAGPGQFSCVLLPRGAAGTEWGTAWNGIGMRGNESKTLEMRGVVLPSENLLGEAGDQIWYVFNVVAPYFLIAMAGTYLGIAAAALEEGRRHLRTRQYAHSGTALAHQPVLQHRIGVLWAKVARTRALVHYAAAQADAGAEDALPLLCAAKAEVADCATDVVNDTMTLLGGKGYGHDSRIHRMMRDARAAHVMSPTTDLLRTWTGRAILDLPLLAE